MNCANCSALLLKQKLISSHACCRFIVCYLAASAIIIIIIFVTLCTLLGFFFLFCLFCPVFVYIVLYYCMLPLEVNKVVHQYSDKNSNIQ